MFDPYTNIKFPITQEFILSSVSSQWLHVKFCRRLRQQLRWQSSLHLKPLSLLDPPQGCMAPVVVKGRLYKEHNSEF
jgi:hypothetical protein